MYNLDEYLTQVVGTFSVCYQIAFCSIDLVVFIFPTLLADNTSTQSPYPVGRVTYIPCLLYCFTLISIFGIIPQTYDCTTPTIITNLFEK